MVWVAGQRHLIAGRIHHHVLAGPHLAVAGVHLLDPDDVGVGVELHIVENAHRRHDEAHLDGKRAAQRLDLLGQPLGAVGRVDQRQQRIAQLDLEIVHLQGRGHRLLGGSRLGGVGLGHGCGDGGAFVAAVEQVGKRTGTAAECEERDERQSGQQSHRDHHRGRHAERLRVAGKLAEQRLVGGAADAGLGHQQARGGRHDQRRNLRDQAVADGEQRVGVGGIGEAQAFLHDADDHAADDVDDDDEQAGDGVAADEFGGAVHGAEEAGFVFQGLAPPPRFLFVDQAGGQVGVDRHLLAGHAVQVEARRDFGDAPRTLGDDDEIDDHQDGKDDDADDEIAAHHEVAERLDDVTGGLCAFVAVGENEPRRGEVERQPQHRRNQQHGRERGEFERRLDEQRRHQDQHGKGDRDGERKIQQQRRQRQDEDQQDRHHADGESNVAPPQHRAEVGEPRQRRVGALRRRYVGHVVRSAPPVTVACFKGLRGGRRATGTEHWCRARVQGWSPGSVKRVRWKRLRLPGKICRVYGYCGVNAGRHEALRGMGCVEP